MLALDGAAAKDEDDTTFDWKEVKKAMTLPHVVVMGLLLFTGGAVIRACSGALSNLKCRRDCFIFHCIVSYSLRSLTILTRQ